jgi:hypothetical protein
VLFKHGIEQIYEVKEENPELYSQLADEVVAAHVSGKGITVCKGCHAKIDQQYRAKQN